MIWLVYILAGIYIAPVVLGLGWKIAKRVRTGRWDFTYPLGWDEVQ